MSELISGILIMVGSAFFGYTIIWLFPSKVVGIGERLLLGLMISLGLIPILLFYGLLAGSQLSLFSPWILAAVALIGCTLWATDISRIRPQAPRLESPTVPTLPSPFGVVLIGVMTLLLIQKAVFVVIQGLSLPTYFWDAIAHWNYRAKVLYFTGQLDLNPQSQNFLGGGISHYPLGPSIFRAWMATLVGSWNEKIIVMHSMIAYLLLFALIWINLSRKIGRREGFVFSYLAVSLPLMVHHAYAGYADLLLSLFFTGCLIYGYECIITRDPLCGIVSALFLVSSLFTKNEGLVLILPVIIIAIFLPIWRRQLSLRSTSIFFIVAAILIFPWVTLKVLLGLSFTGSDLHSVLEVHLHGLTQIFIVVFQQGSFNLFGVFFIFTSLLYLPVWWRTDLKYLAFPILLFMAAILVVYLFTKNYEFLEIQTAFNRTLMLFMPSYIYLTGLSAEKRKEHGCPR